MAAADAAEVDDTLDAAAAVNIVDSPGRTLRFVHALVHEVGRDDGAVVAGRVPLVLAQPGVDAGAEVVEVHGLYEKCFVTAANSSRGVFGTM